MLQHEGLEDLQRKKVELEEKERANAAAAAAAAAEAQREPPWQELASCKRSRRKWKKR